MSSRPFFEDQNLAEAGQLYQTWCHNQPLYLFRQEGFLETLQYRDRELRLAIQALSCRFPPGTLTPERQLAIDAVTKTCRKLVTDRVADGKVKLSTLQTLCVLSMTCFAGGNVMQAGLDLGMAHYFANSLPLGSSLGDPSEFSLCIQGISLLQSIQESIPNAAKADSPGSLFKNANHLIELFNRGPSRLPLLREPGPEADSDSGILSYVTQAAEVWHMARAYAALHVGPDEPPPWSPQSDYSLIMLRNLELDSRFPLKYRFATNNFSGLTPGALHQRRDYWGPWLFIQFVHAAIPTLVNHPFLLSMRLRNFRRMMPQTFIHQSFDHISRHTTWTICFLDLVEKKQFQVSDPLIAHCVAIVATVHLQHSFVRDDALRKKAQDGYDKCMRFLDRMGLIWPFVYSMTQNLRKLQDSITTASSVGTRGNPHSQVSWSIDAQLLWDILIYEKAGCRRDAAADRSMFSDAITPQDEHREQDDVAEFAMVGSAGISGHKTVPREISAYAPEDSNAYHRLDELTTPTGAVVDEFSSGAGGGQFEGDLNMVDQDSFFLQAEDFGRAINDWINFDMT
ncbi:hypothetical protein ACJ41O_003122 [Fusarium nematophilum]